MEEAAPKGVHALSFASLAHKSFIKDVSFAYTEGRQMPLRTRMKYRYKRLLQALRILCVCSLVWEKATFFVLHFAQLISILIWCVFPLKCAYHVLQHIYHTKCSDHSDANEWRLFGMYPNPPSHYTGFLNHLVWICIRTQVLYFAGLIFCCTKAAVCAHYSLCVTYSDTHAFSWRQTERQNRFHLRRLAVCKHPIQPRCPSLIYPSVSLPPCFVPTSFSKRLFRNHRLFSLKRGDGSRTVCCNMALTAYYINAVCLDPTVSQRASFSEAQQWNILTHLKWKQDCHKVTNAFGIQLVLFWAFLFRQHDEPCNLCSWFDLSFMSLIHTMNALTPVRPTVKVKETVAGLQGIIQIIVNSCTLVHNEIPRHTNTREHLNVWLLCSASPCKCQCAFMHE